MDAKYSGIDFRLDNALRRRREAIRRLKEQKRLVAERQLFHDSQQYSNSSTPRSSREIDNRYLLPPIQMPMLTPPAYSVAITGAPPPLPTVPLQVTPRHTKSDIMDLMMLQSAQLHQVVMNQMTMSTLRPEPATTNSIETKQKPSIRLDDILKHLLKRNHDDSFHDNSPPNDYWPPFPPPQNFTTPVLLYYQTQPLRVPKAPRRRRPSPDALPVYKPTPRKIRQPSDGSRALRQFRIAAYAVLFTIVLEKNRQRPSFGQVPKMNEKFLFGIRLRESIAAIHRTLLKPEGKILKILRKIFDGRYHDLTVVLRADANSVETQKAYEDLAAIVENVVYEMTEIMPTRGVLGTHRKSTVYRMIQPRQNYPRGYFWQMERDLLQIDWTESLDKISNKETAILLIGHFLGRGFITSILLKPKEFQLLSSTSSLDNRVKQNLRFLASLFFYILRKSYSSSKGIRTVADLPIEYEKHLYDDRFLTTVYKNLTKNLEYAEKLLIDWALEYTNRLQKVR